MSNMWALWTKDSELDEGSLRPSLELLLPTWLLDVVLLYRVEIVRSGQVAMNLYRYPLTCYERGEYGISENDM